MALKGQSQRVGLTGEYYVVSELLRHDWNAALTLGNTERTDVLAEDAASGRTITLQIKTKQTTGAWRMSGPAEPSKSNAEEWFAFVDLAVDEGQRPDIYFVPRNHVAALGRAQQHFDAKSGGRFINISDIKKYKADKAAWKLLTRPTARVKSRLDDWAKKKY